MATFILLIIYLAFISLGLPDSLLGTAWPAMSKDLALPLGYAGYIAFATTCSTIMSSLFSGHLIEKIGTGRLTLISAILTCAALFGFTYSPSFIWFILLAIPLGLGGGAVDSALNNYVAKHYKAHHMNWLHSFWGVGATIGPIIMASFLTDSPEWRKGYLTIAILQAILAFILLITLPVWTKLAKTKHAEKTVHTHEHSDSSVNSGKFNALKLKGFKPTIFAFLFYCAIESTVGLWGASYLVDIKHISADQAAKWIALYYGGITIGRFITGFVTFKFSNLAIIRTGQITALVGCFIIILPLPDTLLLAGFLLIGLGLAPIFPSLLHETPNRFGEKHASKLMGYQMAMAYSGMSFLPPVFGYIATKTTIGFFPITIIIFAAAMLVLVERVNSGLKLNKRA